MASQSLVIRLKVPVLLDKEAKPVDAVKVQKEIAKQEEEKPQKKDDFKFNTKFRIPALRDRQAKPMDAGKAQREEKPKTMVVFIERKTKVAEEERLEESIKKVKEWYCKAKARKRKIQAIDFQKSGTPCNKKDRKTIYQRFGNSRPKFCV